MRHLFALVTILALSQREYVKAQNNMFRGRGHGGGQGEGRGGRGHGGGQGQGQGQDQSQGRGRGRGHGWGGGQGGGGQGHGHGWGAEEGGGGEGGGPDSAPGRIIQSLLDNNDHYTRTLVEQLKDGDGELIGAHTITQVKDSDSLSAETTDRLEKWLLTHVQQMKDRKHMMRRWDPLFAELHENKDRMSMDINDETIDHGVEVWVRGEKGCPAQLAWKHAKTVSKFVEDGRAEARKEHTVPSKCGN